jgi:hypothetical protein
VVRAGLSLLEAGFPLADLLALAREHNESTQAIAEQAVALFDPPHPHAAARVRTVSDREKGRPARRRVPRAAYRPRPRWSKHHFRRVRLAWRSSTWIRSAEEHELAAASAEAARRLEAGRFPS